MKVQASQRIDNPVGMIGMVASIVVALVASLRAFLFRFNHSPADWIWAAIFLFLCLGTAFLFFTHRYKTLVILSIGLVALFGLIVVFFSSNGSVILGILWLAILALALGDRLLRWIVPEANLMALERGGLSMTLGFGVLAVIVTGIGMVALFRDVLPVPIRLTRLLHPIPVFAILIILSALFLPNFLKQYAHRLKSSWIDFRHSWSARDWRWESIFIAIFSISFLCLAIWALSPTVYFDSLSYHLGAPERYIQNRGILEVRDPNQFYTAHYAEMLFTLTLLIGRQPLPSLLHLLFGVLMVILTYTFGFRVGGKNVGMISAVLMGTLPILFQSATPYNDFMVGLFGFAAIYCGLLWWGDDRLGWLVLAGIYSGLALGTKYNALIVIAPLGLIFLGRLIKTSGLSGRTLLSLIGYAAPTFLLFLPWGWLNWFWVGNPIFPYLNGFFNPASSTGLIVPGVQFAGNHSRVISILKNLIWFPWDVTFYAQKQYFPELPGAVIGGLFLYALPWVYLSPRLLPVTVRRAAIWMATGVLMALILLLPYGSRIRHFTMYFPILCVLSTLNLAAIEKALANFPKLAEKIPNIAVGLLLLVFFTTRLVFITCGWQLHERFPYTVAFGLESPEQYLSRVYPPYDALQYLDSQGDGRHRVAAIAMESRIYTHSEILTHSDDLLKILDVVKTPQEFARALSQAQYDYLLLDKFAIAYSLQPVDYPVLDNPDFSHFFRLEFARNNVYVYHPMPDGAPLVPPVSSTPGENLLQNSDLEQGLDLPWVIPGSPKTIQPGYDSLQAIRVTADSFAYQQVPVMPGKLYTFGCWARSDPPGGYVNQQIIWWNSDFIIVLGSGFQEALSDEWRWIQISVTAPEQAHYAHVYLKAVQGDAVILDRACFAEGDHCIP